MKYFQGYKTEIKPTKAQIKLLNKASGVARFTYNWALAGCEESYRNGDKEFKPNAQHLHKLLNTKKDTEFPWMREVSKWAPQHALINLENAFQRFFNGITDFPTKKKKHRQDKFTVEEPVYCVGRHIKLPKIGKIKIKEKDYIPEARFKSATISKKANRWFVSVRIEEDFEIEPNTSTEVIGIDLGIKTLAVLSSGETFSSPEKLKKKQQRLKRYQRKMSRQKLKSNNRRKTKHKIQQIHFDISNQRKDILHKITSYVVKTKRPNTIVIEDLNIKGMMKNHNLAKAVANIGFYEFRRQIQYKSLLYGVNVVLADRWFPSSRTCSNCGWYNKDLKLSDRVFKCDCGLCIDRDMNAAINLKNYYSVNFLTENNTVSSTEIDACDSFVKGTIISDLVNKSEYMSEVQSACSEVVLTDTQEIQ